MRQLFIGLMVSTWFGCGGSTADTQAWVGNWVAGINETEVCTTGTHVTPLNGAFTIVAGTDPKEIVTQPPNGCNLRWTISGTSAALVGGQTCTVPGSVGGTWQATFTGGTLSLTNNQITVGDQGSALLLIGGATVNCTFTQAGTCTKS
jgi:hypothetical protein